MSTAINDIISSFKTTPVLFIGSGLTRRYLNLPNWENLLKHFANLLSPDNSFIFAGYKNKAIQQLEINGSSQSSQEMILPLTATLIERDFNTRWFEDASFRHINDSQLLSKIQNLALSPFKAEIAHYLKDYSSINPEYTEEIADFKALFAKSLSGIITTNYDTFLEDIAPDYQTYIGQNELIFSPIQEIAEIYKIHGSVTRPESIIINQADYSQFKKHESYLASKLLTIFMEYPIIFIGYSISDANIMAILNNIAECLDSNQLKELQHRFIFIGHSHKPGSPAVSTIHQNIGNKMIPMTSIQLYNYSDLYKALAEKKRSVPVRLLRLFKNEFYKYALTAEPNPKIEIVAEIDDPRINDHDLMISIGTPSTLAARGLSGIKTDMLYQDILFDNLQANADDILRYAYPALKRQNTTLPVFKYLNKAIQPHPEITEANLKIQSSADYESYFLTKSLIKRKPYFQKDIPQQTLSAIISQDLSTDKKFSYICLLGPDKIDVNELKKFLVDYFEKQIKTNSANTANRSNFRRLVRIYDWLKYRKK